MRHAAAIVGAVGLLAAAGCGSDSSGGGGGGVGGGGGGGSSSSGSQGELAKGAPFRVLYVTGLSGPLEEYGLNGLKGLKAAAAVLNEKGGILGHKVEVDAKDDESKPATAVTQLQGVLSGKDKPQLVVDGLIADEGVAMAPSLTAAGIISMNISASPTLADVKKYPWQFIGLPSYVNEGRAVVAGLRKNNIKKAAVVYPLSQQSQEELAALKQEAKAAGITLTTEGFAPTQLELAPTWERAAAAHPDGYVLITSGQAPAALKGRAAAGITAFTQCDTTCAPNPLRHIVSPKNLKNVWTMNPSLILTPPAQRTPAMQQFIAALGQQGMPADLGVPSLEYDLLMVTAEAARQANSTDEQKIKEALENLQSPQAFASGLKLRFSADSHYAVPDDDASAFKLFPADDCFTAGVYQPCGSGAGA